MSKLEHPPFIWLFDLRFGSNTYYFAKNTENVVFGGNTYLAYPIELGLVKSDDTGKIQTVSLSVSNVALALGEIADQLTGAIGSKVTVRLVTFSGGVYYQVMTVDLSIVGARVNEKYVVFELGVKNLLTYKFPQLAFIAGHCQWEFKGIECGYSGGDTVCKKRLEDCLNKDFGSLSFKTLRPFGGFPFIKTGLRVVK